MSKNTTRKSLAFGAGLSLIASGFAGVPANAVGVENFVTLVPTTGYADAYAVIADTGKTFSLTATAGASAIHANKEMKFLVTDPEAVFEPSVTSVGRAITIADSSVVAVTVAAAPALDTVTITDATAAALLVTGDVIQFTAVLQGDIAANGAVATLAPAATAFSVTVVNNDISFKTTTNLGDALLVKIEGAEPGTVIRENRNADNSFIVDSGDADGTVAALVLLAPDAVTRSATVTAFVDFVENDEIGQLDYVSPARTVTFVTDAELTGSFSLTAPNEGDTALAGTFTTTPLLNGVQTADGALFAALFTRQGDPKTAALVVNSTAQNATTGLWPASVNTILATAIPAWSADAVLPGNTNWGHAVPDARAAGAIGATSVSAAKVATVTTDAIHNLKTGDKITFAAADNAVMNETAAIVTVVSTTVFTYPLTETAAVAAATVADEQAGGYTIILSSNNVFAGDYSGQLAIDTGADNKYDKVGTASAFAVMPLVSADVSFSTVASTVLQGTSGVITNDATTDAKVAAGTLSTTVTATVLTSTGVAVGAGRSVAYSFAAGAAAGTIKVNGYLTGAAKPSLTTDANGQVSFLVTDTTGTDGKAVTITATPEGVTAAASAFTVEWDTAALTMYDLNTSTAAGLATSARMVSAGTSYELDLIVADQFFNRAAAGDYRLKLAGGGVTAGFVSLVDGAAKVTVSDAGVATSYVSNLTLQKKSTAGVFADTTTTVALTTNTTTKGKVTMSADASAIFGTTADLADAVASVAIVERDTRVAYAAQPAYTSGTGGEVVVVGRATNSATGVALANSVVTISGASNILFSDGAVDKRGSITVISNAAGQFSVKLYSTTAQTDTVITATANGVSATSKVSFSGQGIGEGTVLTVTTPAAVQPASTFQVKAKLADVYGNGVAAATVKVTYSGSGIVFGTLPTTTDVNGEIAFSVLLGSNDSASPVVTVSYDQNADGDYLDAKDLVTTSTTVITASGVVSADTKVNVGSFKGYVALYAKGYAGKKMSAIVAGKWIVVASLASDFERVVRYTGAGYDIVTTIYIDGVMISTFNTTTK
jgi:hypothetical protein